MFDYVLVNEEPKKTVSERIEHCTNALKGVISHARVKLDEEHIQAWAKVSCLVYCIFLVISSGNEQVEI